MHSHWFHHGGGDGHDEDGGSEGRRRRRHGVCGHHHGWAHWPAWALEQDAWELRDNLKEMAREFKEFMKGHWLLGRRRFEGWGESPDANPFVSMLLTRSGLLPLLILHLIRARPRFGTEIMRELEDRTRSAWTPNPGAVDPLLREMAEEGLVQSDWDLDAPRPRRTYTITERGAKEIEALSRLMKPKVLDAIEVLSDLAKDLFETKGEDKPPAAEG